MKKIFLLFLLIPFISLKAQKIGELAPDTNRIEFPPNSWGVNLMFGEGGFAFGKDDREFDYVDYYGVVYTKNKQNRVYLIPLNVGMQYRLFNDALTDNMRPFVSFSAGPTFVVTNPYEREFFEAIGYSTMKLAVGGSVAIGANFGISKSSLLGLTIKYSYTHIFNGGIESLKNSFRSDLGSLFISLDIGLQY
jgi:hypothetical protein